MYNKNNGKSLEETIRLLHKKYKNAPSPLRNLSEHNVGFTPTQIPNSMRPLEDLRAGLLDNFKPSNNTFGSYY